MNRPTMTPPQRMVLVAYVACGRIRCAYPCCRARPARRDSWAAAVTCSTSATVSTTRCTHRYPDPGSTGAPIVRNHAAYPLKSAAPTNALRLPAACTIRKATKSSPVAAMTAFLPIVVRHNASTPRRGREIAVVGGTVAVAPAVSRTGTCAMSSTLCPVRRLVQVFFPVLTIGIGYAGGVQFHQLEYFVAVADTRHFTQAADRAGVAQPSLSQQIKALERDVGAPLFHRVRGNITLTD